MKELCEVCGARKGITNSRFLIDYENSEKGIWICAQCEKIVQKGHTYRQTPRAQPYPQPLIPPDIMTITSGNSSYQEFMGECHACLEEGRMIAIQAKRSTLILCLECARALALTLPRSTPLHRNMLPDVDSTILKQIECIEHALKMFRDVRELWVHLTRDTSISREMLRTEQLRQLHIATHEALTLHSLLWPSEPQPHAAEHNAQPDESEG